MNLWSENERPMRDLRLANGRRETDLGLLDRMDEDSSFPVSGVLCNPLSVRFDEPCS